MDGKPEGKGVKTWPDGRTYKGTWFQGKPTGEGTKTYPDGTIRKGFWTANVFNLYDEN